MSTRDDDEGELVAPAVPPRRVPEEELWEPRYPRRGEHTPPAGLSRRQQRRWARDTRREERAERDATVRSWRDRPDRTSPGLAVALLAVALLLAGWVLWPRGDQPATVGEAMPTGAPTAPRPPSSATGPSSPTVAAEDDGHDHGQTPAPPVGLFDGPAGEAAYAFTLNYLTYSPAYPDPVGTWAAGWEEHATPELRGRADELAGMWDFTVAQAVHVTDPGILRGTRDGDTWRLRCAWVLFPIGGNESSGVRAEEADVELTVTGGLVSSVTVSGRAPQSDP